MTRRQRACGAACLSACSLGLCLIALGQLRQAMHPMPYSMWWSCLLRWGLCGGRCGNTRHRIEFTRISQRRLAIPALLRMPLAVWRDARFRGTVSVLPAASIHFSCEPFPPATRQKSCSDRSLETDCKNHPPSYQAAVGRLSGRCHCQAGIRSRKGTRPKSFGSI
jgi:hypothetical protein